MPSVVITFLQAAPVLLVLLTLYWVFMRPLRRQVKAHRRMLANLKPGDPVVTEGGILGKVDALIEPDLVRIWIAPDRTISLKREGVAEVVAPEIVHRAWDEA